MPITILTVDEIAMQEYLNEERHTVPLPYHLAATPHNGSPLRLHFFAIDEHDAVVGAAMLMNHSRYAPFIHVREAHRGKGVGRTLINSLLIDSTSIPVDCDEMRQFLEHLGFTLQGGTDREKIYTRPNLLKESVVY